MKQKGLKKVIITLLALVIVLGSALAASAAGTASGTVTVAPENVLNVKVVDEAGNPVDSVSMSLVNASGLEVAEWTSNKESVTQLNESGILKAGGFYEPRSTFEALVAPYTLVNIRNVDSNIIYDKTVWFDKGQSRDIRLEYLGEAETDFTVDGNTLVTVVDSSWASRYYKGYVKVNGVDYILNDNAGKISRYSLDAGTYDTWVGLDGSAGSTDAVTVSNEPTEYMKVRIKLSEIYREFDDTTGIITSNGRDYSLSTDSMERSANLVFVSGSVITAPVPDSQGYVEIYVEKSTRKYFAETTFKWREGTVFGSGGGSTKNGNVYNKMTLTVQAIDYPDDGTNLINVPAGDYTIKLSNIPEKYKPVAKAVTIVESNDVQTVQIVLQKAAEETTEAATEETTEAATEETTEAVTEEMTEAAAETTAEETSEETTEATATVISSELKTEAVGESTAAQAAAPSTGDYTSAMIWLIMFPVSAAALIILFAARNKKNI